MGACKSESRLSCSGRLPTIIKVQDTLVPTFAKGYVHMVRRPVLTHASNAADRCSSLREVTMCAFESQVAGLQAGVESKVAGVLADSGETGAGAVRHMQGQNWR